jgi:hypothetical protein
MIGQPSDLVVPALEDTKETMEELPATHPPAISAPAIPEPGLPTPAIPAPAIPAIAAKPPHPCQIVFKGMDPTEAARIEVRAWLDRLGSLTAPMIGGQVVIEAIDEGRREDRRYHVRMDLTMPEGVVSVGPEHPSNGPHEDVYVAIRNGFRAARRQLEIWAQAQLVPASLTAAPRPFSAES